MGILGGAIVVVYGVLLYFPVIHYKFIVPPGDDPLIHLINLLNYAKVGFRLNDGYPFGFHWLVYEVSIIFHLDLVRAMVLTFPSLLIMSSIVVWWVTSKLFGRREGLVALVSYVVLAYQPLQTLYDGSFPNILAASVMLPIYVMALLLVDLSKDIVRRVSWAVLAIILAVAIVLTHQLTTFYLIAVTIALVPIIAARLTGKMPVSLRLITGLVGLAAVVAVIWIAHRAGWLNQALLLSNQFVIFGNGFPYIHFVGKLGDAAAIYSSIQYISGLGGTVVLWGGLGAIWAIATAIRNRKFNFPILAIVIWLIILFVASRISALGYPLRAARDMIIPLTILASVFMVWLSEQKPKNMVQLAAIALVVISVPLAGFDAYRKVSAMFEWRKMERFTSQDLALVNQLPAGSRLVYSGLGVEYVPFFRSNISITGIVTGNPADFALSSSNYDYVIFEQYNSGVWLPAYLENKSFGHADQLSLIETVNEEFKTVSLYKVVK